MGKLEGWQTLALLTVIFLMVAGCSNRSIEETALPVAESESFVPGDVDEYPDADTGIITPTMGFTFDLIHADSWEYPVVDPGSTHYFSFDPGDLGDGVFVTWDASGGYFIGDGGEYTSTIVTESGETVVWEAPRASGPSEVGAHATGPDDEAEASMVITVDPDGSGARTSQPYYSSLFIDDGFGGEIEIAAGELLVSFGSQTDLRVCASAFDTLQVEPLALVDAMTSTYRVRIPLDSDIADARDEVNSHPGVAFAEYNYIYHLATHPDPDDTYWSSKWDSVRINLLDAWDIEEGSDSVIVAVIDTGVDRNHPDLVNRVISGNDFVSGGDGLGGEVDGDGIDNNMNGWTDENVGHGTHVAGIIAAEPYNGIGSVGVNMNVTILPLRIFPVDGDGGASVSSISSAMTYARNNGASVINMSLGSPYYSSTLANAVQAAIDDGVSVVCAAGNSATESVYYPAGHPGAIAVASIDSSDILSYFSNYGTWVDISAPGSSIRSTYYNDTYCLMSGTSMATPEVAGVVALIWAYKPYSTEEEVRDAIINSADESLYDSNPSFTGKLGSGCLDALGALMYCSEPQGPLLDHLDEPPTDATKDEGGGIGIPVGN